MAFTLVKAIEELTSRLGEPSGGKVPNWAYRHLYYYRFLHSPFSDIPGLSSLFEVRSEAVGNPRTLNMSWAQKFGKGGPYEATAATVYRQVIDLGDPTSIHIAMDLGIQQQSLQSPHRTDFNKLFDELKEMEDPQVAFWLLRHCAGVCEVNHSMRMTPPNLQIAA